MAQQSKLFNADRQIDCTGLYCPMPIVKTREAMTQLAVGQVLHVLSDDPAAHSDVRRWARHTGHDLLQISRSGAVYRFVVRKTR